MTVESQAGKFVLRFEEMRPGEREIVLTGTMGVWQATTHMSLREFLGILAMTLKPRMLAFLARSLLSGGFFAKRPEEG